MAKLSALLKHFEEKWPTSSAEEWDRPGLMVGDGRTEVSKVLISVDATLAVVQEAIESSCQLLISHHPLLLRGVTALPESTAKGRLIADCNRAGLAIFAAHTNADFTETGVTNTLARKLGLVNLRPLSHVGHGAIGEIPPTNLLDYSKQIGRALPSVAGGIKVGGDPAKLITRVGVLAGAGDSYLDLALASDVDLFITSDLRHHPASEFLEQSSLGEGPALIDVSHWAAEWTWLDVLAVELKTHFPAVEFVVSEINTDPWDFAVMQ